MKKKCLYCYQKLETEAHYHEKCSLQFFGTKEAPTIPYSLDEMSEMAKNVVERSITVPGVQPKLSLSFIKETQSKNNRLTVVGALGGQYIFKPPTKDYPELPQNEHATMRMAEAFGIRTVDSSLIQLKSGELGYITKRIDRLPSSEKIHMMDMLQILESFDKYRGGSMEKIGKALNIYSANPLLDKVFYFDLALFSFISGNNDMHLKNFSMIESELGWKLSPAYDLLNVSIANPDDYEEMALSLDGKKNRIKKENFEHFGATIGLNSKQIKLAFTRMIDFQSETHAWVDRSFLSVKMKELYKNLMNERYSRLQ